MSGAWIEVRKDGLALHPNNGAASTYSSSAFGGNYPLDDDELFGKVVEGLLRQAKGTVDLLVHPREGGLTELDCAVLHQQRARRIDRIRAFDPSRGRIDIPEPKWSFQAGWHWGFPDVLTRSRGIGLLTLERGLVSLKHGATRVCRELPSHPSALIPSWIDLANALLALKRELGLRNGTRLSIADKTVAALTPTERGALLEAILECRLRAPLLDPLTGEAERQRFQRSLAKQA